jgi:hypothetical protein
LRKFTIAEMVFKNTQQKLRAKNLWKH